MKTKTDFLFLGLICGVVMAMILFTASMWVGGEFSQNDRAIEVGFAHYDSKTGNLVWDNKDVKWVLFSGDRERK